MPTFVFVYKPKNLERGMLVVAGVWEWSLLYFSLTLAGLVCGYLHFTAVWSTGITVVVFIVIITYYSFVAVWKY
jgi:positive regulator of sigma E activity